MPERPFGETLVTNEQLERKVEFIVDTLARISVNDEKRQHGQQKHEHRLDRVERILGLVIRAGLRERRVRGKQMSV